MRAPFPYMGGKSRVADLVWQRFGNVKNFIEPFFGSGAVLLDRPSWHMDEQTPVETVNDADSMLANFWRALQHEPEAVARHADWPVNEIDLHARHSWLVNHGASIVERLRDDPEFYDAKIAGWWVWGISQWIGDGWCAGTLVKRMPHIGGDEGRGVHRGTLHVPAKMSLLGNSGVGVHAMQRTPQQMPILRGDSGAAGAGINATAFESKHGDLYGYFDQLAARLRRVRVVCGDWARITGPSITTRIGTTGVFLDPPYGEGAMDYGNGGNGCKSVARDAWDWAVANGDDPELRIAVCGYEDGRDTPDGWDCVEWKANGGYGSQGNRDGAANRHRERIWFSPHCLAKQPGLFDLVAESTP